MENFDKHPIIFDFVDGFMDYLISVHATIKVCSDKFWVWGYCDIKPFIQNQSTQRTANV